MFASDEMVTTCEAALEVYEEQKDLRGLVEPWMLRFARNVESPKRVPTVQRVAAFFADHGHFRDVPGFFAERIDTAERLAWDMLGGDAGQRWANQVLAAGRDAGESVSEAIDGDLAAGGDPAGEGVSGLAIADGASAELADGDGWATPELFESLGRRRPEWGGLAVIEGITTDDNRRFAPGAFRHRPLPVPLRIQNSDIAGHDGAVAVGSTTALRRSNPGELAEMTGIRLPDGATPIWAHGVFASGDEADRARQMMSEGSKTGVSADLVDLVVEIPDDVDELERIMDGTMPVTYLSAKIAGMTLVDIPAFQDTRLRILGDSFPSGVDADSLVASGGRVDGAELTVVFPVEWFAPAAESWTSLAAGPDPVPFVELDDGRAYSTEHLESLVAAGGPGGLPRSHTPPAEWFEQRRYDRPTPKTIDAPDEFGRLRFHGHVGLWGSCHIGFDGVCVDVPSGLDYSSFQGPGVENEVECEGGEVLKVGPVVIDNVHPSLRASASDAYAHYAWTGSMVAMCRAYEDEWGLQVQGWVLPHATANDRVVLRGANISPDWRGRATANGGRGVVALLGVPVGGFNQGLVASGSPADDLAGAVAEAATPSIQIVEPAVLARRKAVAAAALGLPAPVDPAAVALEDRKRAVLATLGRPRAAAEACSCGCGSCGG